MQAVGRSGRPALELPPCEMVPRSWWGGGEGGILLDFWVQSPGFTTVLADSRCSISVDGLIELYGEAQRQRGILLCNYSFYCSALRNYLF